MEKRRIETNAKALLYWLRHNPVHIGINVDKNGWADINAIIECSKRKHKVTLEEIKEVVNSDNKNKFEIENNWSKIRAKEGHTISVDI
jgi:putative RNA 2'-phosphotransferase